MRKKNNRSNIENSSIENSLKEVNDKMVELIPREILFSDFDKSYVEISPDGKYISFLAPYNGVSNIWVAPVNDINSAKPITKENERGITEFPSLVWSYTGEIIYMKDNKGDENWGIFSVNPLTGENKTLFSQENIQAQILKVSRSIPNEILIMKNARDKSAYDIYRLNLKTKELKTVFENKENFFPITTNEDYNLILLSKVREDGGVDFFLYKDGKVIFIFGINVEDALTALGQSYYEFDASDNKLYFFDSTNRDTRALAEIDLISFKKNIIFGTDIADISDVLFEPVSNIPQAVAYTYDRKKWVILNEKIKKDFEYLLSSENGEMDILSRSEDDQYWIISYDFDDKPKRYYIYNRKKKEATFLFSAKKALENIPLAKTYPVVIESRDGLKLVSYLTLPILEDKGGKPLRPLPMVLSVHGGPWYRDKWGFNRLNQWLANRGYAVLEVNYRGSTGFGKSFISASYKEWGGKMHNDLVDAVKWAIENNIADPKRITIFGTSYGGYATLVGLTFTPDLFACGVDLFGPSNLLSFYESMPSYWKPFINFFKKSIGDLTKEEDRKLLMSRSPIYFVDNIKKPLLVAQGANDVRVKKTESDQIVKAMKEKGLPVIYILFPDEGHGFIKPENKIAFYAIMEKFLAKYLQGKYEPIRKQELERSSMIILQGKEFILYEQEKQETN
jgi:dipeptidyl aminopeptidase/acylaminoacyl peptidase